MRLVHYYAPLYLDASGVTAAVASWSAAQVNHGYQVTVLGAGDPATAQQRFVSGVAVEGITHRGRQRMTRVPRNLGSRLGVGDLLILHEGWTPSQHFAAAQARAVGVPYLVMPHGVHDRAWRSLLRAERMRRVAESALVRRAAAIHLFFEAEAAESASVNAAARCFAVPTGSELPEATWRGGRDELVWIGRYSVEHKGLDLLLRAMAAVPRADRPRLTMRGNDYRGGRARVEALVRQLGLSATVAVGEPVSGQEKDELLLNCAGYVQPSRWESHSIGLLEALGQGVPCLISDRMPISPDLAAADAAVVSGLGTQELGEALVRLAGGVGGVGDRGRAYVAEHFDWVAVMKRFDVELTRLIAQADLRQ
jgi:glycosyltransferase involved in cell wall biosynthesis